MFWLLLVLFFVLPLLNVRCVYLVYKQIKNNESSVHYDDAAEKRAEPSMFILMCVSFEHFDEKRVVHLNLC